MLSARSKSTWLDTYIQAIDMNKFHVDIGCDCMHLLFAMLVRTRSFVSILVTSGGFEETKHPHAVSDDMKNHS